METCSKDVKKKKKKEKEKKTSKAWATRFSLQFGIRPDSSDVTHPSPSPTLFYKEVVRGGKSLDVCVILTWDFLGKSEIIPDVRVGIATPRPPSFPPRVPSFTSSYPRPLPIPPSVKRDCDSLCVYDLSTNCVLRHIREDLPTLLTHTVSTPGPFKEEKEEEEKSSMSFEDWGVVTSSQAKKRVLRIHASSSSTGLYSVTFYDMSSSSSSSSTFDPVSDLGSHISHVTQEWHDPSPSPYYLSLSSDDSIATIDVLLL